MFVYAIMHTLGGAGGDPQGIDRLELGLPLSAVEPPVGQSHAASPGGQDLASLRSREAILRHTMLCHTTL